MTHMPDTLKVMDVLLTRNSILDIDNKTDE